MCAFKIKVIRVMEQIPWQKNPPNTHLLKRWLQCTKRCRDKLKRCVLLCRSTNNHQHQTGAKSDHVIRKCNDLQKTKDALTFYRFIWSKRTAGRPGGGITACTLNLSLFSCYSKNPAYSLKSYVDVAWECKTILMCIDNKTCTDTKFLKNYLTELNHVCAFALLFTIKKCLY